MDQLPGKLMIETIDLRRKPDIRRFVRVPWLIYRDDPMWVPPLLLERYQHLSAKNPYFDHATMKAWVACLDGEVVGRITAQVDQLHQQRYADDTGFFGLLEAIDERAVFEALLDTASQWLRTQGIRRIRGPFSLSINEETGVLVDGFDSPPYLMMNHAPPYYAQRLEELGFEKAKDMLAFLIEPTYRTPKVVRGIMARATDRIKVRPLRRSQFNEEMRTLQAIFEDAWSDNWGFLPFTADEFQEVGKNLKFLVEDDWVQIAEIDGEPVAMMVTFPNVNEAIRDLDGSLFPFGWAKLLWRLKIRGVKTGRVALLGVRKQYQNSMLGSALAFSVIEATRPPVIKRGVREVEMSWILEDNTRMRRILETVGARVSKRYRVYEKEI
jgi:GNAT superfamily N-acetyltransferase